MAMKYDTMSKRRRGSYDVISGLDEMHSTEDNIKRQASMICENYLNPDKGEDSNIRRQAIACAEVITGAIDELKVINGRYYLKNTYAAKWIDTRWMDVLEYIPPIITELQDSDGNYMPTQTKEFELIRDMLVPFEKYFGAPRSEMLRFTEVYDDRYIFQRVVKWQEMFYDNVVDDVSTGWSGRVRSVSHKRVMTNVEDHEKETSIYPILPEPEEFDHLLANNGRPGGIMGDIEALQALTAVKNEPKNFDYFTKMSMSFNNAYDYEPMIISDEYLTKEFADRVIETCPEYLYYELPDDTFFLVKVKNRNLIKIDPLIKKDYKPPYDKSKDMVKIYVYDDEKLGDIYNNFKYKVELTFELITYSPSLKLRDSKVTPASNIIDEAYLKACEELFYSLKDNTYNAGRVLENVDPSTRCEDLKPEERYDFFSETLNQFAIINLQQCEKLLEFATNTMVPWLDKRTQVLINSTTDRDNAEILLGLLKKRLTKGTGSLLTWYQTTLQFDGTYFKYILTDPIVKKYVDKLLVCKAYDNPSDIMFNKQKKPNYIDIENKDAIYSYSTNFKPGDKIYIICDLDEQENYIESITKIQVPSNDYSDIDVSQVQKEGFAGNLQKYVYVTRLILKNNIPLWCNTDNVSDIRVAKILK